MGRDIVEESVDLITTAIKSNISAALTSIRSERNDPLVSTEMPVNYYISEKNIGYRTPTIFIIADTVNFHNDDRGANHINATIIVNVAAVVEDRDSTRLTRKAWRYQDALHSVLAQDSLTSSNGAITLKVKVMSASFSPIYTTAQKPDVMSGTFRKEVSLRLEVEHYENF